jgi:hypothetical protein
MWFLSNLAKFAARTQTVQRMVHTSVVSNNELTGKERLLSEYQGAQDYLASK